MIIAHFHSGDVQYEKKRLPVVPYKLGIVKEDLRKDMAETGTENTVQVRKAHDNPKPIETVKGDTIVVSDAWYYYMRKLMTEKAWEWWGVLGFLLMKNRTDDHWAQPEKYPNALPRFECIVLPLNFIASDKVTGDYSRIIARDSRNFKTSTLDPKIDNWFYRPWQFSKATTHKTLTGGGINLVGSGFHVYTPIIREEPELWVRTDFVEWFPSLPMDVTYQGRKYNITGYCLQGASVYGHAEEMDIPLRLVRKPGELEHPCPEWTLHELPVPPEVRPEWT